MANTDEIRIDLPSMNREEFHGAVIQAAADKLLARYVYDYDSETGSHDERRVPTELERKIMARVEEVIKEQTAAAAPALVQQLLSREVVLTDDFGYREKPKSVEKIILEQLQAAVRPSSNRHGGKSVLEAVISEQVTGKMREQLEALVAEAREPIMEAVRKEATTVFERAMKAAMPILAR